MTMTDDARTLIAEAVAGRCPWAVVADKLQDDGAASARVLAALRADDLLTAPLTLRLWVSNQPEGANYDTTGHYIDAATDYGEYPDVTVDVDDRVISGPAEVCYAVFRALAAAVAAAGHGSDYAEGEIDAPVLTAAPAGAVNDRYTTATESVCRFASTECASWAEFVLETGVRE